jgi:hypothetical protein
VIEQVLGARILVKRIETPVVTSALLEVVKLDDEPSQFAIVVSVGMVSGGRMGHEDRWMLRLMTELSPNCTAAHLSR